MKPAATSRPFAGPFALGTLSAPDGAPFPALVTPDGRALDLRTALGEPALTTRALLERWDEALPRLHALAADDDGRLAAARRTCGCTLRSSPGRSSSRARTTGST